MALSVFDDRQAAPTERAIRGALGKAAPAWTALLDLLSRDCGPLQDEWSFAGEKYGWSLKLRRGKRAIVYLTPCDSHFLASFALGEKACAAARAAKIPARVLRLIEDAPRYAEGRGVRIPVRTPREAEAIRDLALIKLAH
jgi:hypothetical protein